MEDFVKYNNLFDCYHKLLTEKEVMVFKDYYFDNLSMQEIADNNKVSKSAIHKMLQRILDKLDNYEKMLKINEKNLSLIKALELNNLDKIKETITKIVDN